MTRAEKAEQILAALEKMDTEQVHHMIVLHHKALIQCECKSCTRTNAGHRTVVEVLGWVKHKTE